MMKRVFAMLVAAAGWAAAQNTGNWATDYTQDTTPPGGAVLTWQFNPGGGLTQYYCTLANMTSYLWASPTFTGSLTLPDQDFGDISFSSNVASVDSGAVLLSELGDAAGATSFAFSDTETFTMDTASDGEVFFTLSLNAADLATDTTGLLITAVDNDDANYIPFLIQDDQDGTPDDLFKVDYQGNVTAAGDFTVTNLNATTLVFADGDGSPSTVGHLRYDNTITGLDDGALVWYDDDEVRSLVDLNGSDGAGTALASGDDGKVVKFNWAAGAGYFTLETDSTGSGSLGTNLSSSTNDILSDTGTVAIGGTGNTNNENLTLDAETTANEVAIGSGTGVTNITTGTITVEAPFRIYTEKHAASHTISAEECYGGVHYVTAASTTITLPAVQPGMSVTIISNTANTVIVDANASDLIILDGTALDDGDSIDSAGAAGDIVVLTYYDATGWFAVSNSWTDGGPS